VLGFRRREVAAILIGEIATLVIVALPLGLVLGRLLAALLVSAPGFDSEQFRIPLIIETQTYALAASAIAAAAGLSCWSAWRRLDRLDIVQVLKTRD
jgi:putative ABC transport system permease protein